MTADGEDVGVFALIHVEDLAQPPVDPSIRQTIDAAGEMLLDEIGRSLGDDPEGDEGTELLKAEGTRDGPGRNVQVPGRDVLQGAATRDAETIHRQVDFFEQEIPGGERHVERAVEILWRKDRAEHPGVMESQVPDPEASLRGEFRRGTREGSLQVQPPPDPFEGERAAVVRPVPPGVKVPDRKFKIQAGCGEGRIYYRNADRAGEVDSRSALFLGESRGELELATFPPNQAIQEEIQMFQGSGESAWFIETIRKTDETLCYPDGPDIDGKRCRLPLEEVTDVEISPPVPAEGKHRLVEDNSLQTHLLVQQGKQGQTEGELPNREQIILPGFFLYGDPPENEGRAELPGK